MANSLRSATSTTAVTPRKQPRNCCLTACRPWWYPDVDIDISTGMILHKKLTPEEALEAILFAILIRDLPEDFDGTLNAEVDDEGNVEVYVETKEENQLPC